MELSKKYVVLDRINDKIHFSVYDEQGKEYVPFCGCEGLMIMGFRPKIKKYDLEMCEECREKAMVEGLIK